MENLTLIEKIAIWIIPVIFAITVHETAHGWTAKKFGDPTADKLGRLTLNPLKHIDMMGTIIVPGLMLAFTGFVFGWAKPVPVNMYNLRRPRRDMALVALAGPVSNLLMALAWALFIRLGLAINTVDISLPMIYVGSAGIIINLVLALLNLLPIPPLDGSRIMAWALPDPLARYYVLLEKYGFYILLIMMMTDTLSTVLGVPLNAVKQLFFSIAGL